MFNIVSRRPAARRTVSFGYGREPSSFGFWQTWLIRRWPPDLGTLRYVQMWEATLKAQICFGRYA